MNNTAVDVGVPVESSVAAAVEEGSFRRRSRGEYEIHETGPTFWVVSVIGGDEIEGALRVPNANDSSLQSMLRLGAPLSIKQIRQRTSEREGRTMGRRVWNMFARAPHETRHVQECNE